MIHGHAGPVALVVAAVLVATAGHCVTSAVRGNDGLRRLADVNHAVMAVVMAVMTASALSASAGAVATSVGMVVVFGLLVAVWVGIGTWERRRHGSVDHSATCGTHPWHLVVANGAMGVMSVPGAVAPAVTPIADHSSHHAPGAAVTDTTLVGTAVAPSGPASAVVLAAFVLGLYFVLYTVHALTATSASRATRLGQSAMSAAMAGMLLLH